MPLQACLLAAVPEVSQEWNGEEAPEELINVYDSSAPERLVKRNRSDASTGIYEQQQRLTAFGWLLLTDRLVCN